MAAFTWLSASDAEFGGAPVESAAVFFLRIYRPSNAVLQVLPSSCDDSQSWRTRPPSSGKKVSLLMILPPFGPGFSPISRIAPSLNSPYNSSTLPVLSTQVCCHLPLAASYMLKLLPVIPRAPVQFSKITQSPRINCTLFVPARCPPTSTSHSPIQKSNWRYSGFVAHGAVSDREFDCDVDVCDCAMTLKEQQSAITDAGRILLTQCRNIAFISSRLILEFP